MNLKLIASLLVICLAFSFGFAQAQTGGNNASQGMSQQGNLSTQGNISTLENKVINVSQQPDGDVKWILPGPRRLDPQIFGTPNMPLGFEPEIGVPVQNRSVSGNAFTTTKEPTPFSDNFSRIKGSFYMNLRDLTPVDVNQSKDTATAEFNFTDPAGNITYRVVLRNVTYVGQAHPVLGGVLIDGIAHGKSSIDTRMEPTSYVYGAVWGVGDLYVNGILVSDNRVIHAMATERVRSPEQQGYRLLFDNELPHYGIQAHLLLPDMIMTGNGTMKKQPVPTVYTLPNGQEQPFIHVVFDNPNLEGLKVLNFNNTTANMIGYQTGIMEKNQTENISKNLTGNVSMTGNMIGNMTGNFTENITGNMTGKISNISGNVTGNTSYMTGTFMGTVNSSMSGDIIGDITGLITGNMNGTVTGTIDNMTSKKGKTTGNITGIIIGTMKGDITGKTAGNMTGVVIGTMKGNVIGNEAGNMSGIMEVIMSGVATGNISSVTGEINKITGNITGRMTGNMTGEMTENQTGINNMTGTRLNMTGNIT